MNTLMTVRKLRQILRDESLSEDDVVVVDNGDGLESLGQFGAFSASASLVVIHHNDKPALFRYDSDSSKTVLVIAP